ncbi:MAG TPA: hypothetical protein VM513_33275, partial [Kofleriaceae bacterium]|nr:hypothetical protein [Kofleriaceae bacterium]
MRPDLRPFLAVLALAWTLPLAAQNLLADFFIAATNDRAAEVRALLARGIDPNSVDAMSAVSPIASTLFGS